MWVRGLKRYICQDFKKHTLSHPMWVRGLKHNQTGQNSVHHHVAPHVGAWIETF